MDSVLSAVKCPRDNLQLLGATALWVAAKFDERKPPQMLDFVYVCHDAYAENDFFGMERIVLRTVDYNLGMPLSYTFLR